MKKIISGVYKITNLENGKIYIGASQNINWRWTLHKGDIKKKRKFWDVENIENVVFEVLEEASIDELTDVEAIYIEKLNACDPQIGYNKQHHSPLRRGKGNGAKVRFSFTINKELCVSLKAFAKETGRSINDIVDEAITDLLIKYRKELAS